MSEPHVNTLSISHIFSSPTFSLQFTVVCRNLCENSYSKIIFDHSHYQGDKKYCRRCEVYFCHNFFLNTVRYVKKYHVHRSKIVQEASPHCRNVHEEPLSAISLQIIITYNDSNHKNSNHYDDVGHSDTQGLAPPKGKRRLVWRHKEN